MSPAAGRAPRFRGSAPETSNPFPSTRALARCWFGAGTQLHISRDREDWEKLPYPI